MTVQSVPENVIAIADPKPKPKPERKAKLEAILPIHIVEVSRLVIRSMRDSGQVYPDVTEDSDEDIRTHLFAYLQNPRFAGLVARFGKKAVGVILGHVAERPYGKPSRFAEINCVWIEPNHRGRGIGHDLWNDYLARMKNAGVYHWQAHAHEKLASQIITREISGASRLLSVVGGRI